MITPNVAKKKKVGAGPKPGKGGFEKWAKGQTSNSLPEGEKPPNQLEDKLIDKIGEMRPPEEGGVEGDLGDDADLPEVEAPSGAENVCWAGQCSVMDMEPSDVEELFAYLEGEEPEIYAAVMDVAEAAQSGDAEGLEEAKAGLMEASQMDPVYEEFDEAQREKAAQEIIEYISESNYPEIGTPEYNEAIAHALVEARGGGSDDEFEEDDEDDDLPPDEDEEPTEPDLEEELG